MAPIIVERRLKVTLVFHTPFQLWKRGDMDMTTTGASTYGLQYLHLLRHTLYSSLLFDSFSFHRRFGIADDTDKTNTLTMKDPSHALVLEMFPILILAIFRTSSAVFEQSMR